ncbi:MAG: CYTH domain-containing protein [Methylobacterium sp.]|uniref:CYTH domain-containing protein n=1 Tax=Methylobacterium sp. TaxID=409 RepID=UPI0025E0F49D|nr:CYTH domain-containing protein [Methylobacterium sp.]MBX9931367.1 CYTH domain-containing protein [Methylobacterium sp.]
MRFEIERKFLVAHDGWRKAATRVRYLKDGLIGQFGRGKVRVRLDDDGAWLTVKGARAESIARPEFEYEIPRDDAEAMLRTVCTGCLIEKDRFCVPHAGLVWEVDVFRGSLDGIVLAEVELEQEDQAFDKPDWVGEEVTADLRFRQSTLLHLCSKATQPITIEDVLAVSVVGDPPALLR